MAERIERFEQMLDAVKERYSYTCEKMEQLRAQGKEKSATFRQMMGDKLLYQNILDMYKIYGLIEKE